LIQVAQRREVSAFAPSVLYALVAVSIFLNNFVTRATGLPFGQALDALILAFFLLLIAISLLRGRVKKSQMILILSVLLFTIFSVLGGLQSSLSNSVISAIIFSKFFIVITFARHLKLDDLKLAMRMLAALHIIGGVLSLIFGSFFISLLPDVAFTLDTSRLMGFSLNANRAATISCVLMIYFYFVERKPYVAVIFATALILSESRSLTVLASLFIMFWFFTSNILIVKKLFAFAFISAATWVALYTFIELEDTILKIEGTLYGDLYYIRAAMLIGGLQLASEFFPFGAGGGTFGSSMSFGSQAYEIVGISHWNTVIDMSGIYDSGIGAILGEYGYFGLIFYAFLVVAGIRNFGARRLPFVPALFLTSLVLYMNFFRTVASDFFYSFFFLFLFLVIYQKYNRKPDGNKNAHPPHP